MKKLRKLGLLLFVLLGIWGLAEKVDAGWSPMESNTTEYLFDIWGSSGTDVFAVGFFEDQTDVSGSILHYDGSTWTKMTSVDTFDIWGFSGTDVYASGHHCLLHYNGNDWAVMKELIGACDIWGSSGDDLFVVGSTDSDYGWSNLIWHYDGINWTVTLATGPPGYKIIGTIWGVPEPTSLLPQMGIW